MRVAALLLVLLLAGCGSDVPAGELRYYSGPHLDRLMLSIGADGRVGPVRPGDSAVLDDAAGTLTLDSPAQHVHEVYAFDGDRALLTAGSHAPFALREGDHYRFATAFQGFTIESDGRVVMDNGQEWGRVIGYGDTVGLHRRALALLVLGPLPSIPIGDGNRSGRQR